MTDDTILEVTRMLRILIFSGILLTGLMWGNRYTIQLGVLGIAIGVLGLVGLQPIAAILTIPLYCLMAYIAIDWSRARARRQATNKLMAVAAANVRRPRDPAGHVRAPHPTG
jgi:hypothetical protein